MSLAAATEHQAMKGKQPQHEPVNPRQSVSPSDIGVRHREYHQRMVEHVRNTALDILNNNPFHPPVMTPSAYSHHQGAHAHTHPKMTGKQDIPPMPAPAQRSDTESPVTSPSLPSPGPAFGTADLAQIAFDPYGSRSHSDSTSATHYGDHSMSKDKSEPLLGVSMPFVMGNNPAYSQLLDTSVFPNGTVQMYTPATHISPLIFGDMAGKTPRADLTLGIGLKCTPLPALSVDHGDLPVSDSHVSYSAFDPMTYPYGVPASGAFGYTGLYAPPPVARPSGLPSEGPCINPGYLHPPPPMTASSSHGSRLSLDDSGSRGRQDLMEFPASPLHSVSPSPSPIEAVPRRGGLRRSSDSVVPDSSTGRGTRGHKRKMTWTSGMANEGPNVSQAQKQAELRELERLEQGGAATRCERRRLQNRLAQRAFRARSKLQNNAAATYLTDLEELAGVQAEQLHHMQEALDKLQAENMQLTAERWNQAQRACTPSHSGPTGHAH